MVVARVSSIRAPVNAGIVSAIVGFTGSFPIVLTGLAHVGASPEQAASALMVLCLTMGLGCVIFSQRYKMPITMAWSTPGAALLATTAIPGGGFANAVGAFVVSGILLGLCGIVRPLKRAVEAIPTTLASAMLAGILLGICQRPFIDVLGQPLAIAPVMLVWLVLFRCARRWAVLGALGTAVIVAGVAGSFGRLGSDVWPSPVFVAPHFDLATSVSIGLPLFLVTMTSQNIAGAAVLGAFGYRPPLGPLLGYSGAASTVGALAGGHAINLAAISAALAAGDEAGEDRDRRWIAGVTCGLAYMAFGPLSGLVAAFSVAAPTGLLTAIAGLALIPTFAGSATHALSRKEHREAAAVTFIVAASGIAIAGIGAAFWGLVAGGILLAALMRRRTDGRGLGTP